MSLYHGYIFQWGIVPDREISVAKQWEGLLEEINGISINSRFPPSHGNTGDWLVCKYESPEPLSAFHIEYPELKSRNGFYEYPMVFRATSQGTVIIGSSGTKIVKHFQNEHVSHSKYPELVPKRVKINELVDHLIFAEPDPFAVTTLSVNVEASGENLERADYYGHDLGAAPLITENLKYQTPFMVGVRLRKGMPTEIFRIGSRGFITFSFKEEKDILALEEALSFIWVNKFYLS